MTTNKNLEPIAKQVSLLNRLIELLMAHEYQFEVTRYSGDFVAYSDEEFNALKDEDKYDSEGQRLKKYVSRTPEYLGKEIQDTNGKTLTQKAWSDELVKVTRELKSLRQYHKWTSYYLDDILEIMRGIFGARINTQNEGYEEKVVIYLEAILNKYGRSLSE